jgi:hypothetical protein
MKVTTALLCFCGLSIMAAVSTYPANAPDKKAPAMTSIRVQIGDKVFTARLEDNETARAFAAALLPLTLEMRDLNDNEKVIELPKRLPGKVTSPGTIREGDLMIWSSRNLVLFYKTFPTSYSYFHVGRIDDTTGLAEAVGAGSVNVTFTRPPTLPKER